jgi:hypothetical protein
LELSQPKDYCYRRSVHLPWKTHFLLLFFY